MHIKIGISKEKKKRKKTNGLNYACVEYRNNNRYVVNSNLPVLFNNTT